MITSFNPVVSNNKNVSRNQKQNFGSFPVPRHLGEAQDLLDKVGFGDIKKTPDNIESLKTAFKKGKEVSGGDWVGVRNRLKGIADTWALGPNELIK